MELRLRKHSEDHMKFKNSFILKAIPIILLYTPNCFAMEVPHEIYSNFIEKGVDVSEYEFSSQRLFLVDSRGQCCDLGATLYDSKGVKYCRYIGIAGAWEEKCKTFESTAKFVKKFKGNKRT